MRNRKNKMFDFRDMLAFGVFLIALLTFIFEYYK